MKTLMMIIIILISSNAFAAEYAIGHGRTPNNKTVNRFEIRDKFYEVGVNVVDDKIFFLTAAPMFRFGDKIFFEFGIGVSYFSKTIVDDRNISTHFLFEDKAGVGITNGNMSLIFQIAHYSNCSVKPPNDGFDLLILKITKRF